MPNFAFDLWLRIWITIEEYVISNSGCTFQIRTIKLNYLSCCSKLKVYRTFTSAFGGTREKRMWEVGALYSIENRKLGIPWQSYAELQTVGQRGCRAVMISINYYTGPNRVYWAVWKKFVTFRVEFPRMHWNFRHIVECWLLSFMLASAR